MKKALIVSGIVAGLLGHNAYAAEINDQGARSLQDSVTYYLPGSLKKSEFLAVKPSGNRYEITYDFAKLLKLIDSKDFKVSGLKPYSIMATPLDKGLWKLDSDTDLDIAVSGNGPDGEPTDFTYSITDAVFSGLLDPAISYLRSGAATSGPIRMVSKTHGQEIEASFAGMNYTLAGVDSGKPGSVDFRGNGSFSRFYERIVTPQAPPMQIRATNIDFDVEMKGAVAVGIRDLVAFGLDLVKKEQPSDAEITELKRLIRGAMPLFTSLSETITFKDFTVGSPIGEFGAGKLDYSLTMSEPSDATRIGFGFKLASLSMPSGIVPPIYAQLVPDLAEMEFGLAKLNFTRFVDVLLAMDMSNPGPVSDAEGERLGQAFLEDGRLTIDFPRVVAKSAIYDIEASGELAGYPDQKDRYSLDTTIRARDIDKLIQYFQKVGKTDPQFNQVSFVMMMAKGMAKTEADGRLRWDVEFKDGNSLSVNGQVLQSP